MAANRDVALNILADIKKYQSEIAKIPGTTDKQAAKAALALERRLSKGQKEAAKAATKAAAEAGRAWATTGSLITANLSTDAIKAAVSAVGGFVDGIVSSVDEINTFGAATGLANETVAGLAAAAKASGKSLSAILPADLSKRMLDAANGLQRAKRGFDQLGVAVVDGNGKLRSSDVVLRDLIDSLQDVKDPTERAALATQILGTTGQELLTAFGSSNALDAFVEQARLLGNDVGPDAVKAASEWQAATAELGLAFEFAGRELLTGIGGPGVVAGIVRDFTVGFGFMTKFARTFAEEGLRLVGEQLGAISLILNGEFKKGLDQLRVTPTEGMEALGGAFDSAAVAASEHTVAMLQNRQALEAAAAAQKEAESAIQGFVKAQKDAEKAARLAAKERERQLQSQAKALADLQKIQRGANTSALTGEQKVIRAGAERLEQIADIEAALDELAAKGIDTSEERAAAELAAVEVIADGQRQLSELREKAHAEDLKRSDELAEKNRANAEQAVQEGAAAREESLAAFGEAIDVVGQFGNVALRALSELQRRQADAAREALDNATAAVDRIKSERESLVAQIESEDDAITKARLQSDLIELESSLDAAEKRQRRRRQDARKAFRGEKQAALASVAFNTAAAVLKAYATLGPPPSPAGIASAIAAGAAGLVQGAIVATQQPPQFHTGVESVSSVTRAGDVLASLSPNEAILNVRAADNFGRDAIRAANATGDMGGPPVFELSFERRHVDTMVSRTLSGGGATRSAINRITRSRPAGQVAIVGA